MKMKRSEITKLMMEHSKKMRMSVKTPSEETLAAWRWEDSKNEMILRYYERQEAAEAAAREEND